MRNALYKHFDAEGKLLYIGISMNPFKRLRQHSNGSSWAEQINRVEIVWFQNREEALLTEADLIKRLAPPFNIAGVDTKPATLPEGTPFAIVQEETRLVDGNYFHYSDGDQRPLDVLEYWKDEWPEFTHRIVTGLCTEWPHRGRWSERGYKKLVCRPALRLANS